MKHANIITVSDKNRSEKYIEVKLTGKRKAYLIESVYSQKELDEFHSEEPKWIVQCKGSHCFLADSDGGEDADGHYCGYFDLEPEKAVFENGKLVGFYLCTDGITYSGRGRYNFTIDNWGYPGDDIFRFISWGNEPHVFLFSEPESHKWKDWSLLVREPGKEYKSYLDF